MHTSEIRFDYSVIRGKILFLCFDFVLVLKLGLVNMNQYVSA